MAHRRNHDNLRSRRDRIANRFEDFLVILHCRVIPTKTKEQSLFSLPSQGEAGKNMAPLINRWTPPTDQIALKI